MIDKQNLESSPTKSDLAFTLIPFDIGTVAAGASAKREVFLPCESAEVSEVSVQMATMTATSYNFKVQKCAVADTPENAAAGTDLSGLSRSTQTALRNYIAPAVPVAVAANAASGNLPKGVILAMHFTSTGGTSCTRVTGCIRVRTAKGRE